MILGLDIGIYVPALGFYDIVILVRLNGVFNLLLRIGWKS